MRIVETAADLNSSGRHGYDGDRTVMPDPVRDQDPASHGPDRKPDNARGSMTGGAGRAPRWLVPALAGAAALGAAALYNRWRAQEAERRYPPIGRFLDVAPEVRSALDGGEAVVALESTIITHGMPFPQNVATAREVEAVVRDNGAVPATIAVLDAGARLFAGRSLATAKRAGVYVRKSA